MLAKWICITLLVSLATLPSVASAGQTFSEIDILSVTPHGQPGWDSGLSFHGPGLTRVSASGSITLQGSLCSDGFTPAGCKGTLQSSGQLASGELVGAFTDANNALVTNWLPIGEYTTLQVPARAAHLVYALNNVSAQGSGSFHIVTDIVNTAKSTESVASSGVGRETHSQRHTLSTTTGGATGSAAPGTSYWDVEYLLRRFGFADTQANITKIVAAGGAVPWLQAQLKPSSIQDPGQSEVLPLPTPGYIAFSNQNSYYQHREIELDVASRRQLLQKMVLHWLEHFSISEAKVVANHEYNGQTMAHYVETLRADALGNFAKLVIDVAKEPAMLIWLDNNDNVYSPTIAPNQNFARELLQIYTTGPFNLNSGGPLVDASGNPVPEYTQQDVQQLALAVTGFSIKNGNTGGSPGYPSAAESIVFTPQNHAPNTSYTIMGKTVYDPGNAPGNTSHTQCAWDVVKGSSGPCILDNVIEAIVNHGNDLTSRNTAIYQARELIERFADENPSAAFVRRIKDVWTENYNDPNQIAKVIYAIATDPEFYATKNTTVKEPIEYELDAVRALNGADANTWVTSHITNTYIYPYPLVTADNSIGSMNQNLFYPPDTFSFYIPGPGGKESLFNSEELLNRWAAIGDLFKYPEGGCAAYCRGFNMNLGNLTQYPNTPAGIQAAVTYLLTALVQGGNPGLKAIVTNYMADPSGSGKVSGKGNIDNGEISRALWVILTSPEYEVN